MRLFRTPSPHLPAVGSLDEGDDRAEAGALGDLRHLVEEAVALVLVARDLLGREAPEGRLFAARTRHDLQAAGLRLAEVRHGEEAAVVQVEPGAAGADAVEDHVEAGVALGLRHVQRVHVTLGGLDRVPLRHVRGAGDLLPGAGQLRHEVAERTGARVLGDGDEGPRLAAEPEPGARDGAGARAAARRLVRRRGGLRGGHATTFTFYPSLLAGVVLENERPPNIGGQPIQQHAAG